jgi:hypothetical protein
MSQMENYYILTAPVNPAFYMAGFGFGNLHFIERNLAMPPLTLQRKTFDWIESEFDDDERASFRALLAGNMRPKDGSGRPECSL